MIIRIANRLVKNFVFNKYHNNHKIWAYDALRNIESENGKTNSKLLKLSDEYAIEVLGWKGYAPWLYVYCALSNEFKEGWIPDNYYGKIVVPKIKGGYGLVSDLKSLSSRILETDLLPDLLYHVNGLFVSKEKKNINEKEIIRFLFSKSDKVVYKLDKSEQGKGVFVFDKSNLDIKKIRQLGNGIFQDYISQNDFFNEFMPNSVATIRVTTVIEDSGKASVRACYLRFGRKDDSHIVSSSTIRIPIDIVSGELSKIGYTPNWLKIESHPDTQVKFENRFIPNFSNIISSSIRLHEAMPFARCIGWDLVLDSNDNIKLMEWNGVHNGIKFHESTQGPCFADLGWEKLWKV